jgi:hypothetical protein
VKLFQRLLACSVALAGIAPEPVRADADYSGTYILLQVSTTVTRLPVVDDYYGSARSVSVQKLSQQGDRLRGVGHLCELKMVGSNDLIVTELPDAFRRAIPPVVTDAELRTEGSTVRLRQASQTIVLGAKLKSPETDPLPEKPADPRVTDDDKDGHPGVTVKVRGLVNGEMYLTQRSRSSLDGVANESGFRGLINFRSEQRVLEATSVFLSSPPANGPDPSRSYFILQRVSSGTSCAEAIRWAKRH